MKRLLCVFTALVSLLILLLAALPFAAMATSVTPEDGDISVDISGGNTTPDSYTVTFLNWDGTKISQKQYSYGAKIAVPVDPVKQADETYTYTFAGWRDGENNPPHTSCTESVTYTATYTATYREYTVVFKTDTGAVIETQHLHWNDPVTAPQAPAKTGYTFAGWDRQVVPCAGDAVYTATYTTAACAHTYDNACDPECNSCGAVRSISHSYLTQWSADAAGHWYGCSVCGDKKDAAAHAPGPEATETTAQTCTVCGYVIQAALGHTHSYQTAWSRDKTGHWHGCAGCSEKKDTAAHTAGPEATETTAQTCTVCGYVIKAALNHTHTYAQTLTTDDQGHWYACAGCEEQKSYEKHTFQNSCDGDCDVCGYTRQVTHVAGAQWCSDAQSHWNVCALCDEKVTTAPHEAEGEACAVCGYTMPVEEAEPTTEPTATEPAVRDRSAAKKVMFWVVVAVAVMISMVIVLLVIKVKAQEPLD